MFNGKLIYFLRRQRGYSQQDIADALEVTRGTVSNWEIGRRVPDFATVVILSDIFGVSLDLFVERSPHESAREIVAQYDAFLADREITERDKENLHATLCKHFEKRKNKKK